MNYEERIIKLLEGAMSERGFKLWNAMNNDLVNIWSRPSSSTGKYHKKEDGGVPNIAEHTFEMLNAAEKLLKMFSIEKNTPEADTILFAIALHDALKYGEKGDRPHTARDHDQMIGNLIKSSEGVFKKLLSDNQFNVLEESTRFHSGQWSTDAPKDFDFDKMKKETLLVHMLDMLSTANLLKI